MAPKSLLLALLVVFIWGVNFVVIKIGVSHIPPIALLSIRYVFSGLLFLPFFKWPGWTQAKWCILEGIFLGVLHQGTLFYVLTWMPSGLVSIILQGGIILVPLMGILFFKESVKWRTWLGIFVGLIGVIILVGTPTEGTTPLGLAIALASTFFVSFTYIIMKKIGKIHAPTFMVLMSLPVAPIIITMSFFMEGTDWISTEIDYDWLTIIWVILFEVVVLSFSHMIWQTLMVKEPLSKMAPMTLLIPVFGLLTSILVFHEAVTLSTLIGGGLTIFGVGIITIRRIKNQKSLEIQTIKPL